jgi:hypothetical protein
LETVESFIKEAKKEWEDLKNNGIEDGDLLQVTLFSKVDSKSKAKAFKKLIKKERRYSVDIRPQTGWIGLVIRVKPMRVDFDTIKEMITWQIVNGADNNCELWAWMVKVPFKSKRKTPQDIKRLVDLQLTLIPCPERKEVLKKILITPRKKGKTCWCVAEDKTSGTIIVYDVFTRGGPDYPWGILDTQAKGNVIDVDCLWHASLDDAFINSNLCPESLIPKDYEIP